MLARSILASALVVTAFLAGGCADPADDDGGDSSSTSSSGSSASQDDSGDDDSILFDVLFGDDDEEDDTPSPPPAPRMAHSPPIVERIGARNDTAEPLRITFDGRAVAPDRGALDPDLGRVLLLPGRTVTLRFFAYQVGKTLFAVAADGRILDLHVAGEGDWVIDGVR